jgi:hypothetical protein
MSEAVVVDFHRGRGRPKSFNSPEELESKIEEYFQYCDSKKEMVTNDKGQIKVIVKPYTVTGLAAYLDVNKDTINEYAKKPDYSVIIKNAKAKIEAYIEEGAINGTLQPIFSMFSLKNHFGWVDKHEVVHSKADDRLTADDIRARIAAARDCKIETEEHLLLPENTKEDEK